jgi:ABC-2 type transport system permease protein
MSPKIQHLKTRYRYSLILLRELVVTDFKLRYQNSSLGYLWSLLKPFSQFAILYVIFVKILPTGAGVPHFGVALLLGVILWNYFLEVTNGSINAIVGKGDLLRKVNFPRYVVILSGSVSAIINLSISSIVLVVIMVLDKVDPSRFAILMPLLLAELFVFALAMSFLLSALYVRFRDINHIWDIITQAVFFATPIMYVFTLVSDKYPTLGKLLILNPLAQIIQDSRHILIHPKNITLGQVYGTNLAYFIPIASVGFLAIVAGIYFKKRSPYFAEEV